MNFLTLLCLSPFINGWIHYLMGYDIQWRRTFINWSKHFGARVPRPRARSLGPSAPKCFDHLIKGRLYWISHSIMDSTLDKRGKPLNNRSIYWDKRDLMIFFLFRFLALYCMYVLYVWRLFASLPSRPPGAKNNGKRNLLIQGRMQIFENIVF